MVEFVVESMGVCGREFVVGVCGREFVVDLPQIPYHKLPVGCLWESSWGEHIII